MKKSTLAIAALTLAGGLVALPSAALAGDGCSWSGDHASKKSKAPEAAASWSAGTTYQEVGTYEKKSVVDVVAGSENHKVLTSLVQQAGLIGTLNGDGPFTVFAPTDEAFAAVPKDTLNAVAADEELLRGVLTYHVVAGTIPAPSQSAMKGTVNGAEVKIGATLKVGDANVIASVPTSNGIVHVIDSVLLPPAKETAAAEKKQTIAEIAAGNQDFSTLVAALQAAELVDALNGSGNYTVFAPTNEAFAALPEGTLEKLLANKEALKGILLYHVVDGRYVASDVVSSNNLKTLEGSNVDIEVSEGNVQVGSAQVVMTDINASNGVIHVIDAVLIPES